MRVVHTKDGDAVLDPEAHDREQAVPQLVPVLALEIERVDVLIPLGRILGVADGAVGPVAKPGGMLGHPGVVGRALEGQVEGQLDAMLAAGGGEAGDVVEGAQLGQYGLVAALGGADRPGAADIAGLGGLCVVAPLPRGAADRMHGREVEDVEAHLGDTRQLRLDVAQGAVLARRSQRPGEELVPGAEASTQGLDPQLELGGLAGVGPDAVDRHHGGELLVQRAAEVGGIGGAAGGEQALGADAEALGDGLGGAGGGLVDQLGADQELDLDVLAAGDAALELVAPGGEPVDPAADGVAPAAERIELDAGDPAVVAERLHRHLAPAAPALVLDAEGGGDAVMAIGEHVGGDVEPVAGDAFDGNPATPRRRPDGFDHRPTPAVNAHAHRCTVPGR